MVRPDSEAKYTPTSCSTRLRMRNALRSKSSLPREPSGEATTNVTNAGIEASACNPSPFGSVGTVRQASGSSPSSRTMAAMACCWRPHAAVSRSRNAMPAA